MVGLVQSPAIEEGATEEEKEICKIHSLPDSKIPSCPSDEPLDDLCFPDLDDLPDSFLDFDSINRWFAEGDPGMADLGGGTGGLGSLNVDLEDSEVVFEVGGDTFCGLGEVAEDCCGREGYSVLSIRDGSDGKFGDSGCLIEEKLSKVSLDRVYHCPVPAAASSDHAGGLLEKNENGVSDDSQSNDSSEAEEEDSSSSSSSSGSGSGSASSSSSEEEEENDDEIRALRGMENMNKASTTGDNIDVEEGEITSFADANVTISFSDDEDGDDDVADAAGPITSMNEIKALPHVPPVTVTLQPHHHTMVVGTILSMIGPQVIVEGIEKHSPLNEGSILWINETRLPLGIVDEIFGPVKHPYYIVRYNSEDEVPHGITQGTVISFVPEFASHILNDRSLYQKGYDASGEYDEEMSDELEFSDDEKEAEYKRMIKMKKRGINEPKPPVNKRKERRHQQSRHGNWNRNRNPTAQTPLREEMSPANRNQQAVHPVASPSNNQTYSCSFGPRQDFAAPFSNNAQGPLAFSAPNGMWSNGFRPPQHHNLGFPGGLPPNGMLWMQQNQPFQLFQNPLQNSFRIQQQISSAPTLPSNLNTVGGQSNFGCNPAPGGSPWPTCLDQNIVNALQLALALQLPQTSLPLSGGGGAFNFQPTGSDISSNMQPSPGTLETTHHFNQGRGGGRRGRGAGCGRSGGMRGRYQGYQ